MSKQSRSRSAAHRAGRRSRAQVLAVAGIGVAVVAVVSLLAVTTGSSDEPGTTDAESFDLPALEGDGRVRLADFRGQPVVVNFFASWCTACDAELPHFSRFSRDLEGEVVFVGVNALETGDAMLMPERHDITHWPLARDVGGRNGSGLHQALGGRGMPITAFYDADGVLVHVDGGALPESVLRERLQSFYGVRV